MVVVVVVVVLTVRVVAGVTWVTETLEWVPHLVAAVTET